MSRRAVYTAIFGDRDIFKSPCLPQEDWDFFLFTDQSFEGVPSCVTVLPMEPSIPGDPVRSSKYLKIRPDIFLPTYDLTLWIDGSVKLKCLYGLESFVEEHEIAFFPHTHRTCVYAEAEVCTKLELDDPMIIARQMDRYREEGYPKESGLISGGGILRKSTPAVTAFNKQWWAEVQNGSRRDQLSCNYALWKTNLQRAVLDDGAGGDISGNKWWHLQFTRRQPLPRPTPVGKEGLMKTLTLPGVHGPRANLEILMDGGPLCVAGVWNLEKQQKVVGLYRIYSQLHGFIVGPFYASLPKACDDMKKAMAIRPGLWEQEAKWYGRQSWLEEWIRQNLGKPGDLIGAQWETAEQSGKKE